MKIDSLSKGCARNAGLVTALALRNPDERVTILVMRGGASREQQGYRGLASIERGGSARVDG